MNMFSNKFEKRSHAFALGFVFYNFAAIRRPLGATPSGAPGLVAAVLKTAAVVGLIRAETAEILTMRTLSEKGDEIPNSDTAGPAMKPTPVSAVARWCEKSAGNPRWR